MKYIVGFLMALFIIFTILLAKNWVDQKVELETRAIIEQMDREKQQDLTIKEEEKKVALERQKSAYESLLDEERLGRKADVILYQQQSDAAYQRGIKETTEAAELETKRLLKEQRQQNNIQVEGLQSEILQLTDQCIKTEQNFLLLEEQYNAVVTKLEKMQQAKRQKEKFTVSEKRIQQNGIFALKSSLMKNSSLSFCSLLLVVCFLASGATVRMLFKKNRR